MKIKLFIFLRFLSCAAILLLASNTSQARHILGVDFYYTWVSDSTYKITLVAYGDCGLTGSGYTSFEELSTSTPYICVYDGDTYVSSLYLNIVAPSAGVNVTPVCLRELDSTNCTSDSYTIPGVTKFVYTGNYTLPHQSSVWRFIYLGYMGPAGAGAARTGAITSITGPTGTFIGAIDTLNSTINNHHNSNPVLTAYANPYFCDDAADTYNPGAVDPDGDSLVFYLVPALNSTSTYGDAANCAPNVDNVAYIAPNTAAAPLAGYSSSFSLNPLTGQINFFASALGRPLLVYNVEEYRNDTLIGTSQREMTFLIQSCTGSTSTSLQDTLSDATIGVIVDSTHYKICANSGTFSISIDPREPGSPNTISDSASGLPPGSTFTTTGNGTTTPNSTFTWNTDGVTPGLYNIYITFYDDNCPLPLIQTQAYTIDILNPIGLVSLGDDTSFCTGDSLILSSIGPTGSAYLWSTGSTADSITVKTTGSYWLQVSQSDCVARDTIVVTVNPYPVVNLGPDTTLCQDSLLTLTAPTGYHSPAYLWNTGSTASSITAITAGNYWLQLTANGCPAVSDTIDITYKPLPVVNLGNDTSICQGDSVILTSAQPPGNTYTWSTGSAADAVTVTASGAYWLQVTQNGCSATDTVDVTVVPLPVVTLGPDTTLCAYAFLTLESSVAYTGPAYLWNTGAITPSIEALASGTYWLQVTVNGCSAADTQKIVYNPLPVLDLDNTVGFCQGDSAILGPVPPLSGDTYLWSTGSTADAITVYTSGAYWLQVSNGCLASDTIVVTVTPQPIVNLGPDVSNCDGQAALLQSSYTYSSPAYLWSTGSMASFITATTSGAYWLQVNNAGCTGSDTVNVSIVYDTLDFNNHDTAICLGQHIQVVTAGNPGITYQWLPTAGIPFSTSPDPIITPDTSAMYTMYGFYPGCPDIIDSFFVAVQPTPSVYIGNNRPVCQFDTLHINSSVSPAWYTGYSYSWSPGISLDDSTKPYTVFTAGDSTELVLTVTTSGGCTGVDSALIIVHPVGFATFSVDTGICPHDSLQFVVGGSSVSYQWSPDIYLSDPTAASPVVKPITSQAYTLIATSEYGCYDTMYANVNVYPSAMIYIADSATIYPGESYHVNDQTNCTVFSWFPPEGLSSATVPDPVAMPGVSTKYIVTGITEQGCATTDSIMINVGANSLLALPNAFTPGNGPDNTFYIIKRGEAALNYFRIFNRWGQKVFETTNISEGWDGSFKGTPQPFGVYVYEIEAVTSSGQTFEQHGNVTLVR